MDISTLANLVNAIAVTAGVIFAATQIRDYRRQRRRESMLSLVRSFQSPTFAQALRRVVELPSDTSGKQIQEILGPSGEDMIAHLTGTWESIGVLVFHNELRSQFFPGKNCDLTSSTCVSSTPVTLGRSGFNGWPNE